ncbi:MAG: hypothetical protein A2007_04670 [Verrucomicrobia bacterium GWC2_42_7]|nr:MAG: hypothetical protein A2007_04670 [Verrucomicrobia bacterium GWC2_42_7]
MTPEAFLFEVKKKGFRAFQRKTNDRAKKILRICLARWGGIPSMSLKNKHWGTSKSIRGNYFWFPPADFPPESVSSLFECVRYRTYIRSRTVCTLPHVRLVRLLKNRTDAF